MTHKKWSNNIIRLSALLFAVCAVVITARSSSATPLLTDLHGDLWQGDAEPTVVVTNTPTPASVLIAAGMVLEATALAESVGTATSTPKNWVTATSTPTPKVVTKTPLPENTATAQFMERLQTAIAITTGTPNPAYFVIATDTPIPTPTPEPVIVVQAEAVKPTDTPKPTNTPKPTKKPTPKPTRTPKPTNTPKPTKTPTPIFVYIENYFASLKATPTPKPTEVFPHPTLYNKILFRGDSRGRRRGARVLPDAHMINPDGTGAALMTSFQFYNRVSAREEFSADRQFQAFVERDADYSKRNQRHISYNFFTYGTQNQLTFFGDSSSFPYREQPAGEVNRDRFYGAWDPAWSPVAEKVVLVSNTTGNDEIWVVDREQWPGTQLTHNDWAWDRHPSFSPDGSQIVFFSNRTGMRQLWIMNADGSDQRQLTFFEWEAWDPVWVKYVDQ